MWPQSMRASTMDHVWGQASWACRPSDQLLILALATTLECV